MTAILMSIQPTWVSKILNGKKTLEIRKSMPKCDLPIDVYIYCTKGNGVKDFITIYKHVLTTNEISCHYINGTVVAKFTLNKVEEIKCFSHLLGGYQTQTLANLDLCEVSCLTYDELHSYLKGKVGYAWHIDNLVVFDKPKELSEFYKWTDKTMGLHVMPKAKMVRTLTRAPQSWQFIEV